MSQCTKNFETVENTSCRDDESSPFRELKRHFLLIEKSSSLDHFNIGENSDINALSTNKLIYAKGVNEPILFSQDWPNNNDEWEEETDGRRRKQQRILERKQKNVEISFSQNEVIHKDLERTRKKMLVASMKKGLKRQTLETNKVSLVSPQPISKEDSTSIVGSRPHHWVANSQGSIFKDPINSQTVKASSTKLGKDHLTHGRLPLQLAVTSRAPFSLRNNFINHSLTKSTPQKTFSPNVFTKVVTNSIELKENASSTFDRHKEVSLSKAGLGSKEKGHRATSKKKSSPGPLMKRLHTIRAERNADILRLQSRLSLQDPRRNKPFVDLNLWELSIEGQPTLPSSTLWGRYLAFPCTAYDDDHPESSRCWVLLEQSPMNHIGLILRVYNPVIVHMQDVENSCIMKVIICTQFHEWLEKAG
jgi:hypothetical protein